MLLALVLDTLAWGIGLWPIMASQACSILLFMDIAARRRLQLPSA
jgi:uncharacterized membrane protein